MHRDKERHYGHRKHRGGRVRDGQRVRDREHGHRDRERHGATGIESGTYRDETMSDETMAVAAASTLVVVGAVRGSSRNTDGTTTGATSSSTMTSVGIVVGAKTARLLVEAIEDGRSRYARGEVADSIGMCGAVAEQTQGFWMGHPCTGILAVFCLASETNW